MTSKVLLIAALVAISFALASANPSKCDCGAAFKGLEKVKGGVLRLLTPLIYADSEIDGCAAREANELAENLLYKAIIKVSSLAGIPIPAITERPFTLQCEALKPRIQQFNGLLEELNSANNESVRCSCRNTSLESFLSLLSALYHTVQAILGNCRR